MRIRYVQLKDSLEEINALLEQLSPNAQKLKTITSLTAISLNDAAYLVGEKNETIIAFACVARHYVPSRGWVATIDDVIVDKTERGQRYGTKLMDALMKIAIVDFRADCIELTNNENRVVAHELYKKHGFTKVDTTFFRKKK